MTDSANQTLLQLRDLHLPASAGWWPPAPLWWVLLLLVTGAGTWLLWRIRRSRTPRSKALLQLKRYYNDWCHTGNTEHYFTRTNQLLRTIAITLDDRRCVARLSGEQWIDWLDSRIDNPLSAATRNALADACYRHDPNVEITNLHNEISQWISTCRGKLRA